MKQPFPPPDFVAVESAIPGIGVFKPAPNVEPQREVVAFKCPRCGANTAYSIADGGLACTCGYHEAPAQPPVGQRAPGFEFTVEVVERAARGWGVERKELAAVALLILFASLLFVLLSSLSNASALRNLG